MYKNVILIIISILILFCSIQGFEYMFLSIPVFLMLSYNLSDLLLKISAKPEKKEKAEKNFEYISMIGVVSFFFVLRDFEQTIGGYELFWKLSFFSLLFSLLCVWILNKLYGFNGEKRFYNILSISICFFLLIPNIGIFINKNISTEKENKVTVEIYSKKITTHAEGGDTYEIFFKTEFEKNERLDIKQEFYESISDIPKIVLTTRKGILGYNYVKKIEKMTIK